MLIHIGLHKTTSQDSLFLMRIGSTLGLMHLKCEIINTFSICINPLMAKTAIWQFEIITYAAIRITASDKFLYAFQYTMRLS